MPGISGADINVGWAFSNTWGTPASVTKGAIIKSTDGFDGGPSIVDDDAFNQQFIGEGEAGDYAAPTPEIGMQLRYEGAGPCFMAMAMGSVSAPTVVSSAGTNSLVASSHVITLSPRLTKFITVAVDMSQYVLEVTTLKVRGFTVKSGDGGKLDVTFPAIGSKPSYTSTVNINSTVGGAIAGTSAFPAGTLYRVYRKDGVFRMNMQGAAGLAAGDQILNVKDISFGVNTPLTGDEDHIFGQDYILEPDLAGFPDFPVELTFGRMNTVSANSLARALQAGGIMKADLTFTGLYINSTTQRSMLFQWPSLQIYSFKAVAAGHDQVQPVATFRGKKASAAPTGMAFTDPIRVTVVSMNSINLLS